MRFQKAPSFDRDYRGLPEAHREKFRKKARLFHDAAVKAAAGESDPWPASLRVKKVQGTESVWEMAWSMSDPDGRATWEWARIDDEPVVRWRRLGTHEIFGSP